MFSRSIYLETLIKKTIMIKIIEGLKPLPEVSKKGLALGPPTPRPLPGSRPRASYQVRFVISPPLSPQSIPSFFVLHSYWRGDRVPRSLNNFILLRKGGVFFVGSICKAHALYDPIFFPIKFLRVAMITPQEFCVNYQLTRLWWHSPLPSILFCADWDPQIFRSRRFLPPPPPPHRLTLAAPTPRRQWRTPIGSWQG